MHEARAQSLAIPQATREASQKWLKEHAWDNEKPVGGNASGFFVMIDCASSL